MTKPLLLAEAPVAESAPGHPLPTRAGGGHSTPCIPGSQREWLYDSALLGAIAPRLSAFILLRIDEEASREMPLPVHAIRPRGGSGRGRGSAWSGFTCPRVCSRHHVSRTGTDRAWRPRGAEPEGLSSIGSDDLESEGKLLGSHFGKLAETGHY